jgi:hypothetical protein
MGHPAISGAIGGAAFYGIVAFVGSEGNLIAGGGGALGGAIQGGVTGAGSGFTGGLLHGLWHCAL